jgi:hypothetical protein
MRRKRLRLRLRLRKRLAAKAREGRVSFFLATKLHEGTRRGEVGSKKKEVSQGAGSRGQEEKKKRRNGEEKNLKITNSKSQITNKFQITNSKQEVAQ